MNKIKIGWGEASIVPDGKKVDLIGQFYERISDVVETPIAINSLAIECGDDCVIFCSCDLVSVSHSLLEDVRAALPESFPKDKLIIRSSDTHYLENMREPEFTVDLPENTAKALIEYLKGEK